MNATAPKPFTRLSLPLCLGLVALVLLGAVAAGLWVDRRPAAAPSAHPASPASATTVLVNPEDIPAQYLPGKAPPKAVADAIEAVAGDRTAYSKFEAPGFVSKGHVELIELPFAKVLVTEEYSDEDCHSCTGSLGIYYLKEIGGKLTVTGRWPEAVPGWGWGLPPEHWHVTDRFTSVPAVFASGHFMTMGIDKTSVTLTQLRPEGPVETDVIGMSYRDDGAPDPNGRRPCAIDGRILNIRKDVGFDVRMTGSIAAVDRYEKKNGRFVPVSPIAWDQHCGRKGVPR